MADKSLNRTEFVAAVAAESGQSQAAVSGVVDAFFSVLSKSVGEGTKVSIPGWMAAERTGRNPQTGEAIEIKASHGVKLSAGSKLKAAAKG